MNENLYLGTSGYDYPSWQGVFYPNEIRRQDYLGYYASRFNAVELNYTFYSMPKAAQINNLVMRSGSHLVFCVKANRIFTHEITAALGEDAKKFLLAVEPLCRDNRLGCLLFQFPQSFHYTPDNRLYLDKMLRAFGDIPTAVEFRHTGWCRQSVYDGLEKRKSSLVYCDMPLLKYLPDGETLQVPFVGERAYIRLHGRNVASWYAADGTNNGEARYDYEYSVSELTKFVPIIDNVSAKKKTFIFFNNHPNGSGAKNALQLWDLINGNEPMH